MAERVCSEHGEWAEGAAQCPQCREVEPHSYKACLHHGRYSDALPECPLCVREILERRTAPVPTFYGPASGTVTNHALKKKWQAERDVGEMDRPHYFTDKGFDAIDVIEAFNLGYHLGNVFKYMARAGKKTPSPVEDLKKARWYLDREIARLEKV